MSSSTIQPGDAELVRQVPGCERVGHAPPVRLGVAADEVGVAGVADDGAPVAVQHGHPSVGCEDARELVGRGLRVGEVLEDAFAPQHVDGAVGEGQVRGVPVHERRGRPGQGSPARGLLPKARVGLDAHRTTVGGHRLGKAAQLGAGAGADVDDGLPRLRREGLERPVAQAADRWLLLLRVEERDEGGDAGRAALTDPLAREHVRRGSRPFLVRSRDRRRGHASSMLPSATGRRPVCR